MQAAAAAAAAAECGLPNCTSPILLHSPQTSIITSDRTLDVNPKLTPLKTTGSSPKTKLPKGSAQMNRWSRARNLRSGRRLELPVQKKFEQQRTSSSPLSPEKTGGTTVPEEEEMETSDEEKVEEIAQKAGQKVIYMVSDGTGWTIEHAVNAALGQFEHFLLHRKCAVSTRLFSGIETVDRLLDVIKQAAKEEALLLYTLVDHSMAEPAKHACRLWGVPFVDVLRPTTEAIASHLGVEPSGIPRSERKMPLTEEYFQRIEAVEFTIKQDDGALPQNLNQADIILVGVSRSGKTPLSIYLAQKGYKVANVPLVSGIELPKTLFEIDQEKVFALSINQVILRNIRNARAKTLGFNREMQSNYSEMEHVRKELEFANRIYARNPLWPVIEVTGKAIEETAAVVLRIYHDRKQKFSMPSISRQY